jgi:hypothetical protein
MDRIEPLRLSPGQLDPADGTNLESRLLDALNDPAGEPPLYGIGFDNGKRAFDHRAIISNVTDIAAGAGSNRRSP